VKIHFTPPDYSNVQPKVDDQWTAAEKKKYNRRQHPAKGFVKFQFKKTQYSEIKPTVDTWWKRHPLGSSSNEVSDVVTCCVVPEEARHLLGLS
jgi:hypothetical protein